MKTCSKQLLNSSGSVVCKEKKEKKNSGYKKRPGKLNTEELIYRKLYQLGFMEHYNLRGICATRKIVLYVPETRSDAASDMYHVSNTPRTLQPIMKCEIFFVKLKNPHIFDKINLI